MAYLFQEPALLWLAAAAGAVPVAAHLVARTRPPESRLPTVEFLQRAMRRVWRFRRPQDWLLLVLRTLALVILALAFARPLYLVGEGWGGGSDAKHLVLVVDRSASMAGGAGSQSRFSLAKARALEALREAGRLASVNLVWIDSSPDAVHPGMGVAIEPVEQALRHAEVGGEAGSGAAALALAIERLAGVSGSREMVVVSDFQKGSWKDPLPPFPESIRLVLVPVGAPGENCSLAALECSTNQPLPGESVEVLARVVNHGEERRHLRVALTLGTHRQTRELEIEGKGEGQVAVEFALPEKEGGDIVLRAVLEGEADAIPGDDVRWAMLQAREPLAVTLALPFDSVGETEGALWSKLLRSIPWTREVEAGEPADILVAAGPYEGYRSAAEAVLSRRGGVIFRPTASAGMPADWGARSKGPGKRRTEKVRAGDYASRRAMIPGSRCLPRANMAIPWPEPRANDGNSIRRRNRPRDGRHRSAMRTGWRQCGDAPSAGEFCGGGISRSIPRARPGCCSPPFSRWWEKRSCFRVPTGPNRGIGTGFPAVGSAGNRDAFLKEARWCCSMSPEPPCPSRKTPRRRVSPGGPAFP